MHMLDERIREFLEEAGPVFYVTPSAARAVGLEGVLPDYHVICSERCAWGDLFRKAGAKLSYAGKDLKNSGKILADGGVVDYIRKNSEGKTANILTFKPSPMIEIACRNNGWRYLGNDWRLNREWEDKVKFAEIASEMSLKNAHSRIARIGDGNIEELAGSLDFGGGKKHVVQFSHGYSGNSTFIAEDPEAFASILRKNAGRKAKIADFVEGDAYTFDVCVGDFGILISQPIFQITGFAEFNRNPLGTCGNDFTFGRKLGEAAGEEMRSGMSKVAGRLRSLGYRGILGFDFVSGADGAHIIEVNPRLVGSIPVLTKLQLSGGEVPFLLLHILSFLGFDFTGMAVGQPRQDLDFSQLIMRNTAPEARRVEKGMRSGVYRMEGGRAEFVREAYFALPDMREGEFFLGCAAEGETADPDMQYADIQVPYGIMEDRNGFGEDFSLIKDCILRSIILS